MVCLLIKDIEFFYYQQHGKHPKRQKMIDNMYCMMTEVNTSRGCVFEKLENNFILNNTLVLFMMNTVLY